MDSTPDLSPNKAADAAAGAPTTSVSPLEVTVPHIHPDGMTVLEALDTGSGEPVMAKTWFTVEGVLRSRPYDQAWLFRARTVGISTFALLVSLLTVLKAIGRACVIRGALLPHADWQRTVRRSRERDGKAPTFTECARRWILLDYDSFVTSDFPDPATDPLGCIEAVRQRLPPGLRNVAIFWSFSSSTGIKPGKLGVHFYLLTETPLNWRDTEAFIAACGADVAVARVVQVNYTSKPKFVDPQKDPLPQRFGTLPGIERVPAEIVAQLVSDGHVALARENAVERVTTRSPKANKGATPAKQPDESEEHDNANEPEPSNLPGQPVVPGASASSSIKSWDGSRNRHLMRLAGHARSHGLDAEGLRCMLLAENANHFDDQLDEQRVEGMAASFADYDVDKTKVQEMPWAQAVSLAAGLHRKGACVEALEVVAGYLLGDAAAGARLVDALIAKPDWELDMAEMVPSLVFDPENLP